jgi:hypothetical protein
MQDNFLDDPEDCMRENVNKLIKKIGNEVKNCIYSSGEVIIVEFEGHGNTHSHIRNALQR